MVMGVIILLSKLFFVQLNLMEKTMLYNALFYIYQNTWVIECDLLLLLK